MPSSTEVAYTKKPRSKQQVQCGVCKKWLLRTSLKAHLKIHDPNKELLKHKCYICGRFSTLQKSNLTAHMRIHSKNASETCPDDGLKYGPTCFPPRTPRTHRLVDVSPVASSSMKTLSVPIRKSAHPHPYLPPLGSTTFVSVSGSSNGHLLDTGHSSERRSSMYRTSLTQMSGGCTAHQLYGSVSLPVGLDASGSALCTFPSAAGPSSIQHNSTGLPGTEFQYGTFLPAESFTGRIPHSQPVALVPTGHVGMRPTMLPTAPSDLCYHEPTTRPPPPSRFNLLQSSRGDPYSFSGRVQCPLPSAYRLDGGDVSQSIGLSTLPPPPPAAATFDSPYSPTIPRPTSITSIRQNSHGVSGYGSSPDHDLHMGGRSIQDDFTSAVVSLEESFSGDSSSSSDQSLSPPSHLSDELLCFLNTWSGDPFEDFLHSFVRDRDAVWD